MDNLKEGGSLTPKILKDKAFKSLSVFSSGKAGETPMLRRSEAWWKPAMEIFTSVSAWIVGPIVAALFLGKWLDNKFNSEPWLFLAAIGLAFSISCFGITRITLDYIKKIEEESKNKVKIEQEKDN